MRADDRSSSPPKDSTRSPWLVIVIVTIIVLGIVAFLVLRPGVGDGSSQTNPAAPKTQH